MKKDGLRPGFLMRLLGDRRGNVMAMTAAAIVPLAAMIGGAIDTGRLYMARSRLQQACDAGALAGRKAMDNVNTLSPSETAIAERFFDFNYPAGTYEATGIQRSFSGGTPAGTVSGSASLAMPTTVMRLFGYQTVPLSVTCASTLVVPNTDVMFVLDITGSMASTPSGDSQSKIDGLKGAAKAFFRALGPGTTTGPGRIRYGFMPYSSNVNVGYLVKALNRNYITGETAGDTANYWTRTAKTVVENYTDASSYGPESGETMQAPTDSGQTIGNWTNKTTAVDSAQPLYTNVSSTNCTGRSVPGTTDENVGNPTRALTTEETVVYPDNVKDRTYTYTQPRKRTEYRYTWTKNANNSNGACQLQYRETTYTRKTPATTTQSVTWKQRNKFDSWEYTNKAIDVSGAVRSGSISASGTVTTGFMANPAYYTGYFDPNGTKPNLSYSLAGGGWSDTSTFSAWEGCIEEASTVNTIVSTSGLSVPSGANDLNIDLLPNSANTRWKPYLRSVEYVQGYWMGVTPDTKPDLFACPTAASKLATYFSDVNATTKESTSFNNYVDSLSAGGFTTHDIGLIWGARFLSPTGIFAAENADAAAPGGAQVSRHIVFMTDGSMDTRYQNYDAWGVNLMDGRIAPTNSDNPRLNESHTQRVEIICNEMKKRGFTIWVIGFGISSMPLPLQRCASDDEHWSLSSNSDQLRTRFESIARTIGGLRLSQ